MATVDQSGQQVKNQVNVAGDNAQIDQVGDRYVVEKALVHLPEEVVRQLLQRSIEEDLTVSELAKQPWEPETLFVPAGPFLMGNTPAAGIPRNETPQFEVNLSAFRIGKYPVTNAQYARFIWETARPAVSLLGWRGNRPAPEELEHPVSGVTWYEALDYCQWLSAETGRLYTLATEAQWERAARGTEGSLYPWGEDWESRRCNTTKGKITPVTAFPAQNRLGCFDLVGNAREWTLSAWGQKAAEPDEAYRYPWKEAHLDGVKEPETTRRVFRGGWAATPAGFRCSARGSCFPRKPGPKQKRHGFRVVLLPL